MSEPEQIPKFPTCFVCGEKNIAGLNCTFFANGTNVFAELYFDRKFCGYENIIHGGIVCAVLDEGIGWCGFAKHNKYYLTASLDVKFRRPVHPEQLYRFEGEFLKTKGLFFTAQGKIIDTSGKICAEATGMYRLIDSL